MMEESIWYAKWLGTERSTARMRGTFIKDGNGKLSDNPRGYANSLGRMHAEMINVAGEIGARWRKRLLNTCMKQCKVPEVLSHVLKLPQRILKNRLRERVEQELFEVQQGDGPPMGYSH